MDVMSDSMQNTLLKRLTLRYGELRRSLERIVGSREDAADAMQETWLRVESMTQTATITNPDAYLLRIAANIAIDTHRRNTVLLTDSDVEELLHIADEAEDPLRKVAARNELDVLETILEKMPARRRAILIAARMDGLLNAEIAERFGISVSSVEKELKKALNQCRDGMLDSDACRQGNVMGRRKF
jgi:RNA polymerase sigma factor (sigma-70 family)